MKYVKLFPGGDPINCVWRPVVGYEGRYSVSSTGQVRSELRGNLMAQSLNEDGYAHVKLNKDGHSRLCVVHRLVLIAFVGPAPDGMLCAHNDNDRTNNRLQNLRWDTQKGNLADREKFGTVLKGERSPNARLTADQVRAIRADGRGKRVLADEYGVSTTAIQYIRNRRNWAHLEAA